MDRPSSEAFRLILFVKLPIPGQVKTRLGDSIGPEKAAALYRAWVPPFLETLLELGNRAALEVCVAPPTEGPASHDAVLEKTREWLGYPLEIALQSGSDLTERLTHAFNRSFEAGWRKVLVFGSDSPHLEVGAIELTLDLLDTYDTVLGPAEDGGYYTIGLSDLPESLFQGIRWSGPRALADTEEAIRKRGFTLGKGPMNYDLDTLEDLNRLIESDPTRWSNLKRILESD